MEKNETKIISDWDELIKFVENVNPFVNTVVLTGFINKIHFKTGSTEIDKLVFSTRPVEIIRYDGKNSSVKKGKR